MVLKLNSGTITILIILERLNLWGHNFVKIFVKFLFYVYACSQILLYICIKFRENVLNGFKIITADMISMVKLTKWHNSVKYMCIMV